jgi:uncharacterized membrane protein YedE/YeeE
VAMTNLYAQGLLDAPRGLLMAAFIGVAFGFWLERAGFGSSRKLAAIFYFQDFAVMQVMFTAIVTALLGLQLFGALGLVDISSIYRMETFLWPQVVGGLIFGVGFVVGGWCPGTAMVGLVSGKADALVFLVGGALGSLVYAFAYPSLADFAAAGACGVLTLPQAFGLSNGVTTLLVVAVAIGAFTAIERFSRRTPQSSNG